MDRYCTDIGPMKSRKNEHSTRTSVADRKDQHNRDKIYIILKKKTFFLHICKKSSKFAAELGIFELTKNKII